MQKVSLLKCDNYEKEQLKEKITRSLKNINFDFSCLDNTKVVVKPNFLVAAKDEKAIMTHPEFFRAVIQIIKENGGQPILVESPALQSLETVLKKTPFGAIVNEEGVTVADPDKKKTLRFEGAHKYKQIDISEAYFDADVIISLPKFKTHGITYMSGAVKLLFGAIPGLEKSKMHFKLPNHDDFAEFLLDLYGGFVFGFNPPKKLISIMDAILAMEGEGPGPSGKPKKMDAILVSENAIALDYVATMVAGLDINQVTTLTKGFERNYGLTSPEEIEVTGDTIEDLKLDDFVPAKGNSFFSNSFVWPFNTKTFKNLFVERPVPQKGKCSLCYQCKKICSASAINKSRGKKKVPDYNYKDCIRCYCCMEICPEAAIEKQRGKLQWMITIMDNIKMP